MNDKKEKNSKFIFIIIIVILLIFILWFFVFRDKNTTIFDDDFNSKETIEYDYTSGVLNRIVDENGNPKQNDFIIDGVILIGNRHSYVESEATESLISYFENIGYLTKNINSIFYLNERIEIYLKTQYTGLDSDIKILITPHKKISKYENMSFEELLTLAEEKGSVVNYEHPNPDSPTYIADPFVSKDYQAGKYDILFMYKEKLAYMISIDLSKDPSEE